MDANISNLGELEIALLDFLWERGESDVKTAFGAIGERRGITHNTVQSTLKRLWTKKLLSRHKDGRAYVYAPRFDRSELTAQMVGDLVDQVVGPDIGVALEAFVSLADRAGDDSLDELESLIAERRRKEDDSQ